MFVSSPGRLVGTAARFLILSVISVLALFAQSDNSSVSGFVKDPSGAIVPGAQITLINEATGIERRTQTNESGYYVFTPVPSGNYTVSVELAGFKKITRTKNKVDANIAATVDLALEVGDTSQSVEVVASVARVQADTAALGRVVDREQFQSIQVQGRNPLFLALLKPGVSGDSVTGGGFGLSNVANINGARRSDSAVMTDGAPGMRTRGADGTAIGVADMDSVQEIQVLTSSYPAEYGRSIGGQVRIVTRSGGRDFHGSFYEYFRNSALNANSWVRNRNTDPAISGKPNPFRFNQFGYNFSGPAFVPGKWNNDRTKLFWMFTQEFVRQRQNASTTQTVPSLAMRQGNFSELLGPNTFYSGPRTINDPLTGQPFPGNIIPQSRLSASGIGLLRASAAPTPGFLLGNSNYYDVASNPTNQRKETIALDFNPADTHSFRFRHSNYNYYDYSPFDGTGHTPRIFDRPNKSYSLNYIWTVSPTVVNEMLASASFDRVYIGVDTASNRIDRTQYGINYPYIFPERKEINNKIPTASIQSFTGLNGGPYPAKSSGPIWMLSDNLTIVKSNHTLKFGGLFERAGQNDFDQINVNGVPGGTNNQNGRFEFYDSRPGGTGLAIANAALGLFDNYAELGPRPFTPYRSHMIEWFAQDSWKVNDKLRLELGVRHTIIQPFYSLWRNMAVFDPASYNASQAVVQNPANGAILSGNHLNGMIIPGDGWPDSAKGRIPIADSGEYNSLFKGNKEYSKIHYKDFQPRLGIAYSLDPKTVVRAGAGRFFTRTGVSDSVFLGANPPFQPNASVAFGNVDNPGAAAANARLPLFVTTQDPIFKMPSAWSWNTTFEREVGFDTTVEVSYVGRRGLHLQRERNINQLLPGTKQANPGVNENVLRPYKGYATIRVTNNEASSTYNSLQLSMNRRWSKGLSYGAAYTWSKSMDDASGSRTILPNAYDASTFWGPSDFDRRHLLVVNFIYELPFFKNNSLSGKMLGGWQISGVNQFQTGTPFTVQTGEDFAGVGGGSGSQIWNVVGTPERSGNRQFASWAGADAYWFNVKNSDGSSVFQTPAQGTFTTQRNRNLLYHPGSQSWNLSLFKTFSVTERQNVQFRFETYNFPNHPNWSGADTNPQSSTFGKVTSKSGERALQLSLRYSF